VCYRVGTWRRSGSSVVRMMLSFSERYDSWITSGSYTYSPDKQGYQGERALARAIVCVCVCVCEREREREYVSWITIGSYTCCGDKSHSGIARVTVHFHFHASPVRDISRAPCGRPAPPAHRVHILSGGASHEK